MNEVISLRSNLQNVQMPDAVEAEQALLGTILTDNRALSRVSGFLREFHFCMPEHSAIFAACLDIVAQGLRADPTTLLPHFKKNGYLDQVGGPAQYLSRLVGDHSMRASDAESYGRAIWETYSKRAMILACQNFIGAASSGDWNITTGELINGLMRDIDAVTNDGRIAGIKSRRDVMLSIVEGLKAPPPCNSTGFKSVDLAMGGGLFAGRCYGIGARKKAGKTTLSGSISYNLNLQDVPHLYICLEMSGAEIEYRNMARSMGENSLRFLQAQGSGFANRAATIANHDKSSAYYLDAHSMTFDNLKTSLSMAVSRYKIKGFFLDYLQLVRGKPSRQSTAEFLDDVAQWLANFCRREEIWGVVPFQLNQTDNARGGEGPLLAFDQVYFLNREGDETPGPGAWLEQRATRYTRYCDVGSIDRPALYLNESGPYFEEAQQ